MVSKKNNYYIIKYFGLVILIIILSKIDLVLLKDTIFNINLYPLIVVMVLHIPHLFTKSYRWNLLLKQQNINYSPVQSFLIYMSSLYIGLITPGRIGEFVKVYYLKSDKEISISKGFSSVLADRLFDMYLLIILSFIGIWQFGILGELSNIFLVLAIIVVLTPLIMLNKQFMEKVINTLYKVSIINKVKNKIEENFEDFYNGVQKLISPRLLISGLLTCFAYIVLVFQAYLLVIAIGQPINFITVSFLLAITSIVTFIPISISGLGTRDAVLIYLFSIIGLSQEIAITFSFLIFITLYIGGGLLGAACLYIKPIDITK